MIGLDPNIAVTGLLASVPATIAAVAALRNVRSTRELHNELASPNGTTTAQAIQDIKALTITLRAGQELHEIADHDRFAAVNENIQLVNRRATAVERALDIHDAEVKAVLARAKPKP